MYEYDLKAASDVNDLFRKLRRIDINVILWGPFGNGLATAFWQNIDILTAFESVRLEVKSIVGYKDAC